MGGPEVRPDRIQQPRPRGLLGWIRSRSLWVLAVGSGCCRPAVDALRSPPHDLARLGVQFCTDPAHADVLLICGRLSLAMVPYLRSLFGRMNEPCWVLAAGACACSGGAHGTYATVQGVDRCLPVDLYVPGCPPTPEDLTDALLSLQGRGSVVGQHFNP